MAEKETHYQVGICPNCSTQTRQQLEFATNECNGLTTDRGKPNLYGEVHTLSLFRCNGCNAVLLYKTHFDDIVSVTRADNLDPRSILELDDFDGDSIFTDHSSRLYATPLFQEVKLIKRELSRYVPKEIKSLYDDAFKVRSHPNSFAIQIRKTLGAICVNRGELGHNLLTDLRELSARGEFPPTVADIADQLRRAGNSAAHDKHKDITDEQAAIIDDFFHLVIRFVYDAPACLEDYRKLLEPEIERISDDTVN